MAVDLEYALALRDRATEHCYSFHELTGRDLWKPIVEQDGSNWVYSLHLNRDAMLRAAPVLSDCSINIANALDNIIAAMVRFRDPSRRRGPYFPFRESDQQFHSALADVEQYIGGSMASAVATNHLKQNHNIPHMAAIKKISNTSKHWKLVPSNASARAVALNQPGSPQRISISQMMPLKTGTVSTIIAARTNCRTYH